MITPKKNNYLVLVAESLSPPRKRGSIVTKAALPLSGMDSRFRGNDQTGFRNRNYLDFTRGTTLPEMLVAVSITVGMLMISGMIFSSATTATGRAVANTDIMHQHRILTHQLETDIKGLRTDMPLALIFESYLHPGDPAFSGDEYPVRSDRIVFFANGNYQNLFGFSGNAARIFYGQSDFAFDAFPVPPDSLPLPPRRILTRRWKILTPDSPWPQTVADWLGLIPGGIHPAEYDSYTTENASLSVWKAAPFIDYQNSYFREDQVASLIRRPSVMQTVDPALGLEYSAIQSFYMLPDVTNLKIQFWYLDNNLGQWRWFPTQDDLEFENDVLDRYSLGTLTTGNFALAWNINGIFPAKTEEFAYINGPLMPPWICLPPGHILQDSSLTNVLDTPLPRALKFTYTLHDKNRARYPEGQTFSYIIKLPQ